MQKIKNLINEDLKGWKPFDIIWLVLVSVIITVMSILFKYDKSDQFYWIHIVAAACGIINVVLGGKGKLSNYLFGFIHCCLMIYITLISRLYADFGVTVYNFVMLFVGFFNWAKNMNHETHEVMKIHASNKTRLISLAVIVVGTIGFGLLMKYFTNDIAPFEDGYLNLTRRWKKGDVIRLHFDMQPRTVRASNKVEADRGMVSIERGPIVYCAEWADNDFDIMGTLVNQEPRFELGDATIANTPVKTIKTQAQTLSFSKDGRLEAKDASLTLIPYYAWCHRGSGKMSVWLAQDLNATTPTLPTTLASQSKVETSSKIPALTSLNDRLTPRDENDRSVPYTHWWPKQASTEWITYEFPTVSTIQSSTVWWFDDGPWGGCRLPKSWNVYYRDEQGNWQPVAHPDQFGVKKGMANTVNFDPVKTKALKLEVTLPDDNSAGIFEWSVK